MPRKATTKAKAVRVPVEDMPPVDAPVEVKVAEPAKPTLPIVEGVQVVEILPSGETATQLHVRMADGTTRHVDRSLFN